MMRFFLILSLLISFGFARDFDRYDLIGNENGSRLLIIGGIHGDEPGGYFAPAIFVKHYKIKKGVVTVIPNLNFNSILRNQRGVYGDMNRKFGDIKKTDKDYNNIVNIKNIILEKDVDFIINLHDGRGYYRHSWENSIFNPRAWGQAYIIDQKSIDDVKFGDLDKITNEMVNALNKANLEEKHHTFNVKNTFTKEKDEQMQMSLTFFAISHLKPSLAIETSKNITELKTKVLYQLHSIEALMNYMGIEFERDFELHVDEVDELLKEYGTLSINDTFTLPLDDSKSATFYLPIKNEKNSFKFSHPLGAVIEHPTFLRVMVGNKPIIDIYHQKFSSTCTAKNLQIKLDDEVKDVKVGDIVKVKRDFMVVKNDNYRTNVIGFVTKDKLSQDDVVVKKSDIIPRFSIDKSNNRYRVEFYDNEAFCGGIIVEFEE